MLNAIIFTDTPATDEQPYQFFLRITRLIDKQARAQYSFPLTPCSRTKKDWKSSTVMCAPFVENLAMSLTISFRVEIDLKNLANSFLLSAASPSVFTS